MAKTVEEQLRRLDQLKSKASNVRNTWQALARNFMPDKAYITESQMPGEKHNYERLYDLTPLRALAVFAAGVHGYLTNPATRWFSLRSSDRKLQDVKSGKIYFHEVGEILQDVFQTSDFSPNAHEVYRDGGGLGSAIMAIESDPIDKVRYTTMKLSECFIDEGPDGRANTLYREFTYTVEQAYIKWGDKIGPKTMEKLRAQKFGEEVKIVHAIYPREIYEFGKQDNKNMPIASLWINMDEKLIIREGGFREFPFAVVRTDKKPGNVWGDSLCMTALPSARQLQRIKKTVLRSAMKRTDPPYAMPYRSAILPLNLNPAALNFTKRGFSGEDIKPLGVQGDTGIGLDIIELEQEAIKEALFNDLFVALGQISKEMTVPEVNQRIYEKMILLGPIIGRLMKEFLDVVIGRTYTILGENGELPEPPIELEGGSVAIDYVSPLATSQKMATKTSIEAALFSVAQLGQVDPGVYDRINFDETAEFMLTTAGVPPELIRDDEEVADVREAREEKQRIAELAALAEKGTEIARNASEAKLAEARAGAV